jgi:hypothetical protein
MPSAVAGPGVGLLLRECRKAAERSPAPSFDRIVHERPEHDASLSVFHQPRLDQHKKAGYVPAIDSAAQKGITLEVRVWLGSGFAAVRDRFLAK